MRGWSARLLFWKDAQAVGLVHGRGGVGDLELLVYVADMRDHGVTADLES